jgi:diguanylate cyclase (GGDEF)-like protein
MNVPAPAVLGFDQIAEDHATQGKHSQAQWLRVLVVEDDPIVRNLLTSWLDEVCHHTVKSARNGNEALQVAVEFAPHVVITDWRMPEMDGVALCKSLRSSAWGLNIYVIMLTAADQESELVDAFDAGVDDYVSKPPNLRALSARLKGAWRYVKLRESSEQDAKRLTDLAAELALTNRRLQMAALTDPLTRLANRRAGLNALTQAWSAATRRGQPLTLISFDIDHFKLINDRLGHTAGDTVLQVLAKTLGEACRKEDTVCRWGGEEFLVISPNVALHDGIRAAERLRRAIAQLDIPVAGTRIQVKVSLGIAAWESEHVSQDDLLSQVDEALYCAKEGGRNCLGVYQHGQVRVFDTAELSR